MILSLQYVWLEGEEWARRALLLDILKIEILLDFKIMVINIIIRTLICIYI